MSKNGICKNCEKEGVIHARGLCRKCYQRLLYSGSFESNIPKCKIEGCEKLSRANGYCSRHYHQLRRVGQILNNNPSRIYLDKNEIITYDIYAEIILYNKDNYEKCRALIDIEDIDKIKDYKWNCASDLHVQNNGIWLHRLIMNCTDENLVVDHINHNPLDNRKCNLRICTSQENSMNSGLPITNKTGVIGLVYNKKKGTWKSNITVNTKVIMLGEFTDRDEAIKERLKAEVYYFKEFAPQKHLYEQYGIDENAEYEVKQWTPKKNGNKYGVKGVFPASGFSKGKWKVEFKDNGKNIYLGYYDTLEEAIKVRQEYKAI